MKKQTEGGRKVLTSTTGHARVRTGKPHKIKSTPHGLKGPKRKKPLPPWREIRDKI